MPVYALPTRMDGSFAGRWFGRCLNGSDPGQHDDYHRSALDFLRPWRSWLRSRARRLRTEDCGVNWDRLAELPARLGHPEAAALAGLELRSTLNQLSGDTREVVMLDACGFTYQQIAKRLGLTPKAVECRLSKARKQLRLIREKRRFTA